MGEWDRWRERAESLTEPVAAARRCIKYRKGKEGNVENWSNFGCFPAILHSLSTFERGRR